MTTLPHDPSAFHHQEVPSCGAFPSDASVGCQTVLQCCKAMFFCSTENDAREQAALAGLHAVNDYHIYGFHMRGEGLSIEESQWRKGSQVRVCDEADRQYLAQEWSSRIPAMFGPRLPYWLPGIRHATIDVFVTVRNLEGVGQEGTDHALANMHECQHTIAPVSAYATLAGDDRPQWV